jgi:CubicO group peptidase (beta-lactamase class C family)
MPRPIPIILLLCASMTAAAASPIDPQMAKHIDTDVATILARSGAPAAALEVVQHGKVIYSHAYGDADREKRSPATSGTYFEIGSITKQFTAAAILQLQQAGKLHLDDKLSTYLPDAPHAGEVTLRQLLAQVSGLPDYLDAIDAAGASTKPATFDQLMSYVAGKPLDFEPGSHWAYSNTNYILAGRVIEVASHESYQHYVQTHLLDPTGMTHTFTVADEARLPGMATGYDRDHGEVERGRTIHASVGWSAGFLVSTVADLEKWDEALRGGGIVTPADYALMSTSGKTTAGNDTGYGLGLFVDSIDDQPRVGHTGGSFGFTTANEYFPRQDVQIIAFTNLDSAPEPGEMITTAVFEDIYPSLAAAAARPAAGEDPKVTAVAAAVFAGLQSGTEDSADLTAKFGGKLTGLAQHFAGEFAPYGKPTRFVFKGTHTDRGFTYYDYVIYFGPGSAFKLGIGLDVSGKVGSLSFG